MGYNWREFYMKKVLFCFVIIFSMGFTSQKMNYASGISRLCSSNIGSAIGIMSNDIGDFGYFYLGTLDWKTTQEVSVLPGGWVYVWKKDNMYYWSDNRHPENANEFKRIYKDDVGCYIYYFDFMDDYEKAYLSYTTSDGYPLVTNIEMQVSKY